MWYELTLYSLKVGACLAVFYLFFKLLLSRETFHRFNRIVVLAAMVVSFLLPLCVITVERELPVEPALAVMARTLPDVPAAAPAPEPFPWRMLVGGIFVAGVAVTCLRTFCSLGAVVRLICRGRRERQPDGVILVHADRDVAPFSWGRCIVMTDRDLAENGEAILTHERAHLQLHHSVDLLVTDLAGCLQWFNPAMWLLRRELRAIHEYEADEAVLRSGVDARSYQKLLIKKAVGGRWYSVANSLNHSKLKNRITMMLRKRSSRWAEARVLLLLPLAGVALGAFAETRYVPAGRDAYKDTQNRIEALEKQTEIAREAPIVIQGTKWKGDPEKAPLILVNGERVTQKQFKKIPTEDIEQIWVLKDSTWMPRYGEEARNGVIYVQTKDATEAQRALQPRTDEAAFPINASRSAGDSTAMDDVVVISYASEDSRPKSSLNDKAVIVFDGKLYTGDVNALPVNQIGSMSIYKSNIPEEYRPYLKPGKESVIVIESRKPGDPSVADDYFRSEEWQQAQKQLDDMNAYFESDTWKEGMKRLSEMDMKSEEMQRKLSEMEDYFQSEEWKETQRKLAEMGDYFQSDEWQQKMKQLSEMEDCFKSEEWQATQKRISEMEDYFKSDEWQQKMKQLSDGMEDYFQSEEWQAAQKRISEMEDYFKSDEWQEAQKRVAKLENSLRVENFTLEGDPVIYINGKRSTREAFEQFDPEQIRSVTVLSGKDAVRRLGEEARGGALDVRVDKAKQK